MSDNRAFDSRYAPPGKVSDPAVAVADFALEAFPRVDSAAPLPDPTEDMSPEDQAPPPNPFEEFQVEQKKVSELPMPSLDGLFKPFDLTEPRPAAEFQDLADLTAPRPFDYEDLDTRDRNVVRTLAQAEARGREMIQKAQAEAFALIEAARTEAQGLVTEARARAGTEAEIYAERLRREAEIISSEAESLRGEAEALRGETESLNRDAEKNRAEAEADLTAVKDRIAGLDRERRAMEEDIAKRHRELEAEYQVLQVGLTARREEILVEARTAGRREGFDQGRAEGLAEGRAEGLAPWREKTARLAGLLERLENIYQDLWRANGPMMIQLAIEAAEGILNKELKSANDLAVRAFETCIDYLGQAHRVVFQARPQDIPLLEEARAEQRQRLGALVKVTFQPDERLGPGDLIVESDVGRLDATVKHRAGQVLKVLREAFESAEAFKPPAEVKPAAELNSEPGPAAENLKDGSESVETESGPVAEDLKDGPEVVETEPGPA